MQLLKDHISFKAIMHMDLLLHVCATRIPAHARVNYRCYPQWNTNKSNLDIVWDGKTYSQPWKFNVVPDRRAETCVSDSCVQRLWCTDSGAAGWYNAGDKGRSAELQFTWLRNTTIRGSTTLINGGLRDTSPQGPSTITVLGNTIYFIAVTVRSSSSDGLPRLNTLIFHEYAPDTPSEDLWERGVVGFTIPYSFCSFSWTPVWSAFYPSAADTVTLSVENFSGGHDFAIDFVVTTSGASATRGPSVFSYTNSAPSVMSATREMITTPGFTCGAFSGSTYCHRVGVGRWTWDSKRAYGISDYYSPFEDAGFALPAALWLHYGENYQGNPFRAVVGGGLSPAFSFRGSRLYTVEMRKGDCSTGNLVLVVYHVEGTTLAQEKVQSLGCASKLQVPEVSVYEASYAAAAVKWAGPWTGEYLLFTAQDLAAGNYNGIALTL